MIKVFLFTFLLIEVTSVPGRKPGKFLGQDTLPGTIIHAYYYRYKVRSMQAGILRRAKRTREDPERNVSEAEQQRQVFNFKLHHPQGTVTGIRLQYHSLPPP